MFKDHCVKFIALDGDFMRKMERFYGKKSIRPGTFYSMHYITHQYSANVERTSDFYKT